MSYRNSYWLVGRFIKVKVGRMKGKFLKLLVACKFGKLVARSVWKPTYRA